MIGALWLIYLLGGVGAEHRDLGAHTLVMGLPGFALAAWVIWRWYRDQSL